MKNYQDKTLSPRERARDLLSRMSLEEKMAQVQCYLYGHDEGEVSQLFPYGLGEVSCLEMRQLETIDQAIYLQHSIQSAVIQASPHGVPAIFHMEGLCGLLLKGAASFPCGLGRGASFDPALEEEIGRAVGREAAAMGITHIFAPVLDVSRNPRFGRYGESYGEDPALASVMGTAYARGVHDKQGKQLHTESVAKHFLATHANEGGLHTAAATASHRELREVYGKPFQAAMDEGELRGIMPCYNSLNGVPVSGDRAILTGLLREEMGFDGVALSDYTAILKMTDEQGVGESRAAAGLMALSAGMDMEFPHVECCGEELRAMFAGGEADMAVLDRAVLRVLETKFRMGLFEHPYALQGDEFDRAFYLPRDHALSRRSAAESLVLLKNDGVLPITAPPKRIAVIGWHAGTIRSFFGGYTHLSMAEGMKGDIATMAGVTPEGGIQRKDMPRYPDTFVTSEEPFAADYESLAKALYPEAKTLYEAIKDAFPGSDVVYAYGYDFAGTEERHFRKALALARNCDLTILTLGGKHGTGMTCSMGENVDSTSVNLPPAQEKFIEKVCKVCPRVIGIHLDGRPISSDNADKYLSAILEAWSPAEGGPEAICGVLTGKADPSGRLPVTVARNAGQLPIYYDHQRNSAWDRRPDGVLPGYVDTPYTPRYPFGFGLSYASFDYSDLRIEESAYAPDETVTVTARVTNTGAREGTTVAQLYVRDVSASVARPVLELQGACRVTLRPGEGKTVQFTFPLTQLAFLDRVYRWKVEKGAVKVLVGPSSAELPLEGELTITEDKWLESGRHRGYFARSEVIEGESE